MAAQAKATKEVEVTGSAFRILTVCTGNICRSPVAERLIQAALGDEVTVASAGIHAMVGDPIQPDMVALLDKAGLPSGDFVARQVTSADVRDADLVLALTRQHRAYLVEAEPAALRRTFTLLEFARIVASPDLPSVPPGPVGLRLRALVPLAARHRAPALADGSDDVPDPYGRGSDQYELAYALIRDAVDTIARVARGESG